MTRAELRERLTFISDALSRGLPLLRPRPIGRHKVIAGEAIMPAPGVREGMAATLALLAVLHRDDVPAGAEPHFLALADAATINDWAAMQDAIRYDLLPALV